MYAYTQTIIVSLKLICAKFNVNKMYKKITLKIKSTPCVQMVFATYV